MTITTKEAADKIRAAGGAFFTVDFVKRTTGELRSMNCRTGVQKHLKGGDAAYNFTEHNLVSVWDVEKKGYRSIPVESIKRLALGGEEFTVDDGIKKA